MASDDVKTPEDADMSDCDGQKVVTMMDVLQEQEDFEDDANAVLGASDDKNCTYSKGYVKRQAIYACLTCCPDAKTDPTKRAGVCLACSLACHESHELVELYTKRNFRCDCGNPKFKQPCQFTPNKTDLNYENRYNQNFSGVYCICHRPYPDPEATVEDEMIQCVVCEDWLHTNHLEATVPLNDQYAEMICKDCMEDDDFLFDYSHLIINTVDKKIIVTDPDLDFPIEEPKQNGNSNEELPNNTTKTNGDAKDDKKVPDNVDNSKVEEKDEKQEDSNKVKMAESKPNGSEEKTEIDQEKKTEETQQDKGSEEKTEMDQEKKTEETQQDKGSEEKTEMDQETKTEETQQDEAESLEKPEATVKSEETKASAASEAKDDKQVLAEEAKTDSEEEEKKKEKENNVDSTKVPDEQKSDEKSREEMEEDKLLADEAGTNDMDKTEKTKDVTNKDSVTASSEKDSCDNDNKRKLSTENEDIAAKKTKVSNCTRPRGVKRLYDGATFWPANLRQQLCKCNECISMYKDLAVLFLIDPEDTVTAYEALGKDRMDGVSSQYEKGLQALSSLDRVQQINALTEYNRMRDKLLDFLKSFKDRREIVKEEDIKAFFAGMKPKREQDGVYFCR